MTVAVNRRSASLRSLKLLMGGASVAALVLGAGAASAQVVGDSTRTSVATSGNTTSVTTTNINAASNTAFNRFSQFTVQQPNTVNLVLPTGTYNLVNVVSSDVKIDGTVNSRLLTSTGDIGGNLYFITTGGFLVGSTGSLNTGRLIVRGKDSSGNLLNTDALVGQSAAFATSSLLSYAPVSSASISGRVNAPGGIDIKATTFAVGATGVLNTGAAGVAGVQVAGVVSTAGLVEGAALVKVNGGIAIVGADSVTVAGGATLDARASATPVLGGGIDIASAGQISLAGTLTAWDGTAGSTAADISVLASKTVEVGAGYNGVSAALLANYFTASSAKTGLDVTGMITGANISLASDATATTGADFNPVNTTLQFLGDYVVGKLLDKAGASVDVLVTRADAQSAVTVGSAGRVNAKGNLTVSATSTAAAEGEASADTEQSSASNMAMAVGVAQLVSKANVTVDGQLKAGGTLNVTAANDATSDLEVEAISTETAKVGAVAYTEATVTSSVSVGSAALLDGSSVTITAKNMQADGGFDNKANVYASDGSAGGGSAAVLKLDLTSNVNIAGAIGSLTVPGSVTIAAETVTEHVINSVGSSTGSRKLNAAITKVKTLATGGSEALLEKALGQFASAFDKIVLGDDEDEAGDDADKGKSTRFGAAIGVLFDNQKADVSVTGSVVSAGMVTVDSLVRDKTVRNIAKASTAATKAVDGEATSIAGAAAWSDADYLSHAIVGGVITSGGLAVNALTDRPRGGEYDLDFSSEEGGTTNDVKAFASDLFAKVAPDLGLTKGFFTSAAGATAKTDSAKNASISGSVSYTEIAADTKAWINPLAQLTLSGALAVKATTNVTVLNLGGAMPTVTGGVFGTSGGDAAGIAVAFTKIDPTTIAGIGKGVVMSRASGTGSVNVDVDAKATISAITLAPQAGKGNGLTGSGTFATNMADGITRATISKDARLDLGTGKLGLDALSKLELWAVGGSLAVTKADGTGSSGTAGSVGVAGALNDVDFDTRARVSDASDDDAAGAASAAAATTPGITAKDVAITATSTGSINAISVAGSATSTTPAQPKPGSGSQTADKKKGTFGRAKEKLDFAAALINAPLVESLGDYAGFVDKYASGVEGAAASAQQDSSSKGTPVTKGFGVAGSASVNLSDLTTRVETSGGNFKRDATSIAAGSSFLARAAEGIDMLSVTGGAAISTGKKLSGSNTLIAGAYGLSYSNNDTASALSGGSIDGFGTVSVEAAANGSRIGAGLALTADTTQTESGAAISASVSHLIARDGASATVTDGAITGGSPAAGSLSILAYNSLTMGAGAGGLSFSSSNAAGGAVTVIDIAGPAGSDSASAKLVRTPVSGFIDVSVRALTASRVAGIAAAGAISKGDGKKALAAGLSINLISMDSTALIDTGATGAGTIDITGAVNVYAGDKKAGETEALAASGKTSGTAGTTMLSSYTLGGDAFDGSDPIQTSDLKGGSQILSIAVPIAASRGGALGMGFAWNSIDNDRTASIIGGSGNGTTPTITAASMSVQAIEHSDILALGVGIGAASDGTGLMGSISRNLIEGSSSAGVGRSAGATNNLVIDITGTPAATPNVSIGASGDGGIFALAGAIAFGKSGAGGIAVGVNDITRTTAAGSGGVATAPSDAGLHAAIDGISFKGTPDVDLLTTASGRIIGNAIAVAGSSNGAGVAGAATANGIAPTIASTANRLNYLDATTGDLKIRAKDESSITSTAIVAGISANSGGVAAGVSVNRIDANVEASLKVAAGDAIRVRNLILDSASHSKTTAFGLGAGGGTKFGGAGSIAVNLTDSDTVSLLTYTGGEVSTTGSIGVVSKRDMTIDVGAGTLAIGAQGAAIGASVIVNDMGGTTDARIVGNAANTGTINAFTGSGDESGRSLTGLRTGGLDAPLKQFDALSGFFTDNMDTMVRPTLATFKGVAVNASSTAATRTIAITGAISGQGVGIGVTGVVNNVTGATNASIADTNISVGSGSAAQAGVSLDVRASSQQVGMTFAGAIAGSGGGVAAAAPVISDGYEGSTTALISGGSLASTGTIAVKAVGNQSSTTLAVAGAVSGSTAAAVSGVSPRFNSTTTATLNLPKAVRALGSDGVAVNADSSSRALATFGSLAVGGNAAGAGAIVVATNENKTGAVYRGITGTDGLGTVMVDAAKFAVAANGNFDAMVAGASVAASAGISLVGNGVGVVHRGEVYATADALKYARSGGTVDIKAIETVSIVPIVGQVAVGASPTGAGASLGVIAVLAQSKVDATLSRPSVVSAGAVNVQATGYNQIDAVQLGVAIGGIGIGANVTYLGIGKVTDTGALTASSSGGESDNKIAESSGSSGGGNKNLSQLSAGGSRSGAQIAAQTNGATTSAEQSAVAGNTAGRAAFTSVASPGDDSASRVRAQVTGNGGSGLASVGATTLTIDSDANLRSKSTNIQGTAGLGAGSATVGITRNAAQSIAYLGNVSASGGAMTLTATTGQAKAANAPVTVNNPTQAAEAEVYSGTVGVGALSVGVADVKLQSAAVATVDTAAIGGGAAGVVNFGTTTIAADDLTSAKTYAVGAVAGAGAVNVVIAKSIKDGTVVATLAGRSSSDTLNITATGTGGATAQSYAGSGGIIFAGNAAVAIATDNRTIKAVVAEGASILSNTTLRATSTPLVSATSVGVAISGGIAAGASVAEATSNGTVSALVGEGGAVSGNLTLLAQTLKPGSGDNVTAKASGSAGGYLAAANGATATARTSLATNAVVGANLTGGVGAALVQIGKLDIKATREISQYASATGVTVAGILAIGIQRAESKSDGDTRAAIENVDGTLRYDVLSPTLIVYDDASVVSDVLDHNRASVTAGAGGLGAGVAADAETSSNGNAVTEILTPTSKMFLAGALTATAHTRADYRADSDATLATVAGGSGTTSTNRINSAATVNIGRAISNAAAGANSNLKATSFRILADNQLDAGNGGSASGAGGGVVTGQAALVKNELNQASTVNLRDGLTMRQFGGDNRLNMALTTIDASVEQARSHSVALDVGGALQTPYAKVSGTYNATNTVNIGNNILIRGDQGIGVGTNVQQAMVDTAAVQIYGLAGLGGGSTDSTTNANSLINVGNGTTLEALADIRISTGTSSNGVSSDTYRLTTQTDTFNNTALPLNTEASAYSNVFANNRLVLGDATIRSARDLIIESETTAGVPSASGTGHNPYLVLFSLTTHSGDTQTKTDSSITMNGTDLIAGYLNNRTVTIETAKLGNGDDNPNAVSTIDGVALAGSTGLVITTNNADFHTAGDTDWLGKFSITAEQFNSSAYIQTQITALTAQAAALGLTIPTDPATAGTNATLKQQLRDALNVAAAKSSVLAQLGTLFETRAALADAGAGLRDSVIVGAGLPEDSLFAAGGRISFGSDAITASNSSAIAYGGANVTIQNNTTRDTVIGNIFIPFKVDGAVDFSGKAREIAGFTPSTPGTGVEGTVAVTTGAARSDIVVVGSVNNIAGAFRAKTPKGNYIQFGEVNVANFSADSPNGLFTVSIPTGTFSMGLPLAYYYGSSGTLSLYSVNGRGATVNPETAIEYVASSIAAVKLGISGTTASAADANAAYDLAYNAITVPGSPPFYFAHTGDVLFDLFLAREHRLDSSGAAGARYKGTDGGNPAGHTIFGSCLTATCEFASHDGTFGAGSGDYTQSVYTYDGDSDAVFDDDHIHTIGVRYHPVALTLNPSAAYPGTGTPVSSNGSSITATQVLITAQYVDISGTITAGPIKERSITISDTVKKPIYQPVFHPFDWYDDQGMEHESGIEQRIVGYETQSLAQALGAAKGGAGAAQIDLLQNLGIYGAAGSGQNLGAQFVRTGVDSNGNAIGTIKIDDVAAAGGGSITIAGKILNTNPLGQSKLVVLNGYGNINVDNKSGFDLEIGTINAGLSADGRITLRDADYTTEYVNSVGGQVSMTEYRVTSYQTDANGNFVLDIKGNKIAKDVSQTVTNFSGNQGLLGGPTLQYQPTGAFYYVWNDHQTLARSVSGETGTTANSGQRNVGDGIATMTVSPWADISTNKQAPQLGEFLNVDAPGTYDATKKALTGLTGTAAGDAAAIKKALNGRTDQFVQVVTGSTTKRLSYYYTDDDENAEGFMVDLPTVAEINILSAAKATNPIKIVFDQGLGNGGLNIKSNNGGSIRINGTLTFGGGTTAIETNNSIIAGTDGLVISKNVSLTAATSIGTIGRFDSQGNSLVADAAFRANLLGGSIAATSLGEINLSLKSAASNDGVAAPILIDFVRGTDVKIAADTDLVGISHDGAANILATGGGTNKGDITLDVTGKIRGAYYTTVGDLASQGLVIDTQSGMVTVNASDDVALQQGNNYGTGTDRVFRVGSINTSGDVLIKSFGSIIAADATATVDQAKLDRFLAAAKALQLTPECSSSCGIVDPASLGIIDQAIRAEGYAAYDNLHTGDPATDAAAEAKLTALFGFVPAGRGAIATLAIKPEASTAYQSAHPIGRDDKIAYQLRNQGRDAYDRYALTNAAATAEDSRGLAVNQTLTTLDKIAALAGKGGITLSFDSKTVSVSDATAAALLPGGDLYLLALSTLAAKGTALAGATPTVTELETGLQFYLNDLRAPVATLLPVVLPDLTGLTDAAKTQAISGGITGDGLTAWVAAQNLVSQRSRASADALGKVEQINALGANPGVSLAANGKTLTISDSAFTSQSALKEGGSLYELGLATLRAQVNDNGLREKVPLPTNDDIRRGLQMYLDQLRAPLNDLLPGNLPVLTATDPSARLAAVSNAISNTALSNWASKQQAAAVTELTGLFGTVPVSRTSIDNANLVSLAARTQGSMWTTTQLEVSIPSTAFVPVADSQIDSRKPVITARGVTLVAGNSIGAFDAQRTFSYGATGYGGATDASGASVAVSKDLATAYLASAGPGDLQTQIFYDDASRPTVVTRVLFTTRRDQPLQLDAGGTVNAIAATNFTTLAPTVTAPNSAVIGDIFLNNTSALTIGTIVSEKWRSGTPAIVNGSPLSCALGAAPAATCDSRIRIVAPEIIGTTTGAAALSYILNNTAYRLDSGDGSAIIMGGQVRLEASNGAIVADDHALVQQKHGGEILVDTNALEVLRAAGDISLRRRSAEQIGYQSGGTFGTYHFGDTLNPAGQLVSRNDLMIGDVFSGQRLEIDNPYGSLFVIGLDSKLGSENRNSRIVSSVLSLRAAGDIGSAQVTSAGKPGQFDIQSPVIQRFVAGYDYAANTFGSGPAPAGLAPGNGYFALRGISEIGAAPGTALRAQSQLGARGSITIGTLNNTTDSATVIKSSVKFLTDINVGGKLILTTDGDVAFPDPTVSITGIGITKSDTLVDLRALELTLTGRFDYYNDTRSILLGSLTAGGGTIQSRDGSVTVTGTLYGNGGPETPFTMIGKTGVTVGSTGLGSIALISSDGDVRITGQARATDLTLTGRNVYVAGGLYGRGVAITASPTGTVSLGGSVMLQRDTIRPNQASVFSMTGGNLGVSGTISAQDAVNISGISITGAAGTMFLNSNNLTLAATGALRLAPSTTLINIGTANLSSGTADAGGSAVTVSSFSGGDLSILAPVGISLGTASASGGVTLSTAGALALSGGISTGGAVDMNARTISFTPVAGIRDSGSVNLAASETINGSATLMVKSRGAVTIRARDTLALGQLKANGGSINIATGGLTVASTVTSDGSSFRIQTGGLASFSGALALAGSFSVATGGDLTFNSVTTMSGPNGAASLDLDAGGALVMGRNARINATASTASVRITAGTVAMDPLASINGASVTLIARGLSTLGDILASEANGQTVSLRSTGAISAGTITGGATTVMATGGGVVFRNPIKVGAMTVSARDDIVTNGITANQLTMTSSTGSVLLNGTTRVVRTDSPVAARLAITASKAITVAGATSAGGGMTLTGASLATTGSGYLADNDLPGALTTIRADTVNVAFNTGTQGNTVALRVDARGRTGANINDATFRFVTLRPVLFDALYVNKGAINTNAPLSVTALTMRDSLLLTTPNGSVALQGMTAAAAATRTAVTGALSVAKLVVTLGAGAPGVTVNGVAK